MRLYDDIVICRNRAIARAYAKINLTLDVLGRRSDGYHEVCMVMQSIGLFDLIIADRAEQGINISCNARHLPCDRRNIAYKAAELFFSECGVAGGAKILIRKNIPIAAGLAGGSTDAAAVLCALDMLYNTHMGDEELCRLGARLGADVPFCILGGTQLAEGIGERLTELAAPQRLYVLLVKPPVSVSTARIYSEIDSARILSHPDTTAVIKALENADTKSLCKGLSNVMQTVTAGELPEINEICAKMTNLGALGAVMSGSGPTVFGLFGDAAAAKRAHDAFAADYSEVFLTKTYN